MALGLFIAVLPLMGLQLPIALGAAVILRRLGCRLSSVSAATGVWLTNPLTAVPVYTLTFLLGLPLAKLVMGDGGAVVGGTPISDLASVSLGAAPSWLTVVALLIGGVLVGLPLAAVGYRVTLRAVERYRAQLQQQRLQRPPQPVASAVSEPTALATLPAMAGEPARARS